MSLYDDGIVIGCDEKREWLLNWWWEHYCLHNRFPVAFMDFGMSEKRIAWCKDKGLYFSMREHFQGKEPFSWVIKPLACLKSPFKRSIWIDLDCRIDADLSSIFNLLHLGIEIALLRENETTFNAGVVAFLQNAPILHRWTHLLLEQPEVFLEDQKAISFAIDSEEFSYFELPHIYNWSWSFPPRDDCVITHFHGKGKLKIIDEFLKKTNA